jgi:hypothetical protein
VHGRRAPAEPRDRRLPSREGVHDRNHPLVDGNKRLAWLATYVFLAKNDIELDPQADATDDLVVVVPTGAIDEVGEIAAILASFAGRPRD